MAKRLAASKYSQKNIVSSHNYLHLFNICVLTIQPYHCSTQPHKRVTLLAHGIFWLFVLSVLIDVLKWDPSCEQYDCYSNASYQDKDCSRVHIFLLFSSLILCSCIWKNARIPDSFYITRHRVSAVLPPRFSVFDWGFWFSVMLRTVFDFRIRHNLRF